MNGESSAEDGRRQKRDSLTVLPGWNFAQVVVINFLTAKVCPVDGEVKIQSDAQKQSVKDSVMRFLAEDSFKLFVHVFKFFQYCFTQCFHIFSLFPARVSISGFGGRNFLLIDRNSTQPGTLGTAVHRVKSCVTHCG